MNKQPLIDTLFRRVRTTTTNLANGFDCKICSGTFKTHELLLAHAGKHMLLVQCDKCEAYFSNSILCEKHQALHARQHLFACDQCEAQFSDICYLSKHKELVHPEWKCKFCLIEFQTDASLQLHCKEHHVTCTYRECESRYFNKVEDYVLHLRTEHQSAQKITETPHRQLVVTTKLPVLKKRKIKCDQCGLEMDKHNLKRHQTHSCWGLKQSKFGCNYCSDIFQDINTRDEHSETHFL